ncbi:killer cell lectin-like receptor 2 isoform 2-T2 [Hipposideros larvatus]
MERVFICFCFFPQEAMFLTSKIITNCYRRNVLWQTFFQPLMYPGEPGLERPSAVSFLGHLSPPASLLATDTEMSDQEVVVYSTLRFLQSPSQSQNRLGSGGTQVPGKSDDKECSAPWHLISKTLGILCLLLLMTVIVLGTMIFQYIQEKHQQDEILQDLRENYHSLKNDSYLKEQLLTNKTLQYDILKNKTCQRIKEPDLILTENNRCHIIKIFSKPLQNTDKLCEECWSFCGVSYYYFTAERKSWNECKQTCESCGLALLKIDEEDERTFLQPQTNKNTYWIGLSYNERERKWKWIDSNTPGIDLKIQKVHPGKEKCVFLTSTRIESIDCDKKYNCICEKRIDGILSGSIETKEIRP